MNCLSSTKAGISLSAAMQRPCTIELTSSHTQNSWYIILQELPMLTVVN
jgi:hypothetical protein